MENKTLKKSFFSTLIIFFGTLLVVTFARKIAGDNFYIYTIFPSVWFLMLFFREIKTKGTLLSEEWQVFKQKKWKNIGLIILVLLALNLAIILTRPFFNQFIPTKQLTSFNFSSESGIGLFFTFFSGVINLVVAFVEEITYRYDGMYVFKSKKWSCVVMLLLSSILFGFSHYYNFNGSFLATGPYIIAGLILGISYLWSKNIWVPIFSHVIFNSIDILSSVFLIFVHVFLT